MRLAQGVDGVAVEIGDGLAGQLVRSAAVELHVARERLRVGAGLGQRLADIARLKPREILDPLLDQPSDPREDAPALRRRSAAPGAVRRRLAPPRRRRRSPPRRRARWTRTPRPWKGRRPAGAAAVARHSPPMKHSVRGSPVMPCPPEPARRPEARAYRDARRGEDCLGLAALDDLARLHHHHPVGDGPHHAQIVADEEIAQPVAVREPGQQIEDLRPDPHVERRDRLVENDHLRPDDQRAGDGDALALAAGELVDVAGRVLRREADIRQRGRDRRLPRGALRRIVEQMERLGHQPRDPVARVEAAVGVLEHHLHPRAQVARHGLAGMHRLAVDPHLAALERVEPEDRAGQRGFPAAALADQPEALAAPEREAHALHRPERLARAEQPAPRQRDSRAPDRAPPAAASPAGTPSRSGRCVEASKSARV